VVRLVGVTFGGGDFIIRVRKKVSLINLQAFEILLVGVLHATLLYLILVPHLLQGLAII